MPAPTRPEDLPTSTDYRWIPDYEGRYAASSDGRIWSHAFGDPREIGVPAPTGYVYASVSTERRAKRSMARVHRLIYETFVGPIPENYDVDHVDGDRANNAVGNLEAVTRAENIRRRDERGATARGERHGCSVLTAEQVVEIRERYAADDGTQSALADEYGVSTYAVSAVVRGATWAHVGGPRTHATHAAAVPEAQKDEIAQAHAAGASLGAIAAKYGISKTTAHKYARGSGTPARRRGRPQKLNPEQIESVLDAVASGESQASVARRMGCSQPTISNIVRKHR